MKNKTRFKETEIGDIPEDWELLKICEVSEVVGGGTPSTKVSEFWDGDISWITPKDLSNYNKVYVGYGERNITKAGLNNSSTKLLPKGTVLLTTRAPVGYLAIANNEVTTNQGFRSLIPNKKSISEFLFYLLKSRVDYLKSQASGSTFGELSGSTLKSLKFAFPEIKEQRAIAKVLFDLDSKIELNQEINKTLESIAQALFKRWFIDFEFPNENGKPYKSNGGEMEYNEDLEQEIPKGWKVGILSNISKLIMGLSPKSSSYNNEHRGTPLLNGAADFSNNEIKPTKYTTAPVRICKKNDLIFCIRATIGNFIFSDSEYSLGRGVAALTPKDEIYKEYMYFEIENSIKKLVQNASGSVIVGLSKPDIENLKIVIPDNEITKEFHKIISQLLNKKYTNIEEFNDLINIRDFLLPKLMSGKIRVPVGVK